jgi:hypothetical protein
MATLTRSIAWVMLAGAAFACSCGSSEQDSAYPHDNGGSGGGLADGSAGGDAKPGIDSGVGGSVAGCQPPCAPSQLCSVKGTCIEAGTCLADGDCAEGMKCDLADASVGTCVPGGDCGAQQLEVEPVPSNLLIVLDRSCSMTKLVGTKSKWELSVTALDTVIANFKAKLRFGLILFPDLTAPDCGESTIPIPVGDQAGDAVTALLDKSMSTKKPADWYPGNPCVTPIDSALVLAKSEPAFTDATRQSYVLLVTDGQQTACGTTVAAREAAGIQTIGELLQSKVPTFVIGFGSEVDPDQLNKCAEAGGVPNTVGTTKYYDAQDAASLDQALAAIAAKAALSCTLELKTVPPDPSKIYVFFDKQDATRDPNHLNGWDYDAATNRIIFYGKACDDLKNGVVTKVDVVFGCKQAPVN